MYIHNYSITYAHNSFNESMVTSFKEQLKLTLVLVALYGRYNTYVLILLGSLLRMVCRLDLFIRCHHKI